MMIKIPREINKFLLSFYFWSVGWLVTWLVDAFVMLYLV